MTVGSWRGLRPSGGAIRAWRCHFAIDRQAQASLSGALPLKESGVWTICTSSREICESDLRNSASGNSVRSFRDIGGVAGGAPRDTT